MPNENQVSQEPGSNLTAPLLIASAAFIALLLGGVYLYQQSDGSSTTMESAYSDVDSESWMPPTGGTDDALEIQAELEATNMDQFENNMNADAEAAASSF